MQSSLLGSTNSNFEEDRDFFFFFFGVFLRKMEREEVEKKLLNEYEPIFIAKGSWPFYRHIFGQ